MLSLSLLWLQIEWYTYLNTIFANRTTIRRDESIIVPALSYLKKMFKVVNSVSREYVYHFPPYICQMCPTWLSIIQFWSFDFGALQFWSYDFGALQFWSTIPKILFFVFSLAGDVLINKFQLFSFGPPQMIEPPIGPL